MPKRILIDATHVEETRVVVLENGRVTEYDSETSIKKQLKGNVYLAKITRVEPSLQAAFVEYGGDKHGFLPFSEIHPDYYNLPVADKEKLMESIRSRMNSSRDEDGDEDAPEGESRDARRSSRRRRGGGRSSRVAAAEAQLEEVVSDETTPLPAEEAVREEPILPQESEVPSVEPEEDAIDVDREREAEDFVPSLEDEDEVDDEVDLQTENLYRKYKIQEVIKRNQIVLVQVEKEERGNKGASLTTFISLAGRYCVLMPKSLRKGGVSRRIENREDRKRLKQIIRDLNLPPEKGLIVRTAGVKRSEEELRADYDYLANLWNNIVEATINATAPAFIHAEGDIIKRTLRDQYEEKVEEVLIEGEPAFAAARDFMKIMMAKQVGKIKPYHNKVPIFTRYKVEEQIAALYQQNVPLQSGGALVIAPTEALISIDVNSGRSTGQRSVEETAVSTNIEAAYEVARQLRLRDLSGLIVIDFIDMMELRNKKTVERALREAFEDDRARIQIGRISTFGLLEMSRQRLGSSFLEINTVVCPHCEGAGVVKATESTAVTVLRAIENDISRGVGAKAVNVAVPQDVALYILNHKRSSLTRIEVKYDIRVFLSVDQTLGVDGFYIERMKGYVDSSVVDTASLPETVRQEKRSSGEIPADEPVEEDESESRDDRSGRRNNRRDSRRRGRDRDRNRDRDSHQDRDVVSNENTPVTLNSILEGLWRKIVD